MPSSVLGYVPGSGFTPLVSGSFWSGGFREPFTGMQILADKNNSGAIYVSLSGAFAFSGQVCALVASGGPTIQSGAMPLSGGANSGLMDGMQLPPGTSYFVPRMCFPISGTFSICAGADPACSGPYARAYWEMI